MDTFKMKIATHTGSYHADDLCAIACLERIYGKDNLTLARTGDQNPDADFVVDTGGKYDPELNQFDHHQGVRLKHPGGWPMASFGLVWEKFGTKMIAAVAELCAVNPTGMPRDLSSDEVTDICVGSLSSDKVQKAAADDFRQKFVIPVDTWDNGIFPNAAVPSLSFSAIVNAMSDSGLPFTDALKVVRKMMFSVAKVCLVENVRKDILKNYDTCYFPREDIMVSKVVCVPTMHMAEKIMGNRLSALVAPLESNHKFYRVSCRQQIVSNVEPFCVTGNGTRANFNNLEDAVEAAIKTTTQPNEGNRTTQKTKSRTSRTDDNYS